MESPLIIYDKLSGSEYQQMEIKHVKFEHQLVLTINNTKIHITPFLTQDPSNIKIGIDAPPGVSVNREEIYKSKKDRYELVESFANPKAHQKKVQRLFAALVPINNKSEKLEMAAKQLFDREKILTPKTIDCIANGEKNTSSWLITCAIYVLINEKPQVLKSIFSSDDLQKLWLAPLLVRTIDKAVLLKNAHELDYPKLVEYINNHTN